MQSDQSGMSAVEDDDTLNSSLGDVITLLEREVERLRESLELFRLSNHPDRQAIIRWHVQALDQRQDALDEMKSLLQNEQRSAAH